MFRMPAWRLPCVGRMPRHSWSAMSRMSALSPADMLRLDQWAAPLTWMFPFGYGPYLVGSANERSTYRDVDVRQPVPDDDPLFADPDRLRLLNVAMSVWAQQTTGLPVDFQFQPLAEWRAEDGKARNPLGNRWRTIHGDPDEARPGARVLPPKACNPMHGHAGPCGAPDCVVLTKREVTP